ncbi:MAG: sel1 repeat family protein [Myxococcales bacterium]|nr:sel1 repeat family protein [Myxococcales bacterium]
MPKDADRGQELLTRACELGEAEGCLYLGVITLEGQSVPRSPARALELFERACAEQLAPACENAGIVLLRGEAGRPDARAGAARFRQGCELGLASACFNLGVAYYKGEGVLRDFVRAAELLRTACDGGHEAACEPADKVGRQARSRVPGANVEVGALDIDGLRVRELECRLDTVGSLGALALAATLAKQRARLDRCAPKGAAPVVRWRYDGEAIADIVVEEVDAKTARCVAQAMERVKGTVPARCAAIVLIGDAEGADAALARRG